MISLSSMSLGPYRANSWGNPCLFLKIIFIPLLIVFGIWLIKTFHFFTQFFLLPVSDVELSTPSPSFSSSPQLIFHQSFQRSDNQRQKRAVQERKMATIPELCKRLTFRLFIVDRGDDLQKMKRFLDRLYEMKTHGCTIHLHFLLAGENIESVATFADQLVWPSGKIYSSNHPLEVNYLHAIYTAWNPVDSSSDSSEFALVIEDIDRRPPPSELIERALLGLARHFLDGNGNRKVTKAQRNLIGMALDDDEEVKLIQKPSKSMLIFPWSWNDLQFYHQWRIERSQPPPFPVTLTFNNSTWSQHLWEYMILHGKVVLSLGESSPKRKTKSSNLDQIPIYDCLDHQVDSLTSLMSRRAPRSREEYPILYYNTLLDSRSRCILDRDSDPVSNEPVRRRYLLYEPHGSILLQLDTFQKALIISEVLNRTLIVPPLINPNNSTERIEIADYFSFNSSFAKTTPLDSFPFTHFTIGRHSLIKTKHLSYEGLVNLPNPILGDRDLGQGVVVPTITSTDQEVVSYYGACSDVILAFRSLNFMILSFLLPESQQYLDTLQSDWNITSSLGSFLTEYRASLPSPLGCVIYSRGDGQRPCGVDIRNNREYKLMYYRSCQANPSRLVNYTAEVARQINKNISAVYVIYDTPSNEMPNDGALPAFTSNHLAEALGKRSDLVPKGMATMMATVMERRLCFEVDFFMNNVYSSTGRRISEYRIRNGLSTRYLGEDAATDRGL